MTTITIDTISDADSLEQLEEAYFIFECYLDYVARNSPHVIDGSFRNDIEQMLEETWVKYDLLQDRQSPG